MKKTEELITRREMTNTVDLVAIMQEAMRDAAVMPTPTVKPKVNRHFWRCSDCLAVVATDGELKPIYTPGSNYPRYATCGACGGDMEHMGKVSVNHLIRTEERCACDGRCTGATGPSCDCKCGGENHGTGRTVTVAVEAGAIPVVNVPQDASVKGEVYRTLLADVRAAWEAIYREITNRKRYEYLGPGGFSIYLEGQNVLREIGKARDLRVYGTRDKRLRAILAKLAR